MDANKAPPVVHPTVAALSFLLGTWRGQGEGGYPTINSFSYAEELHFSNSPNKPVIGYTQKTWKLGSGEPMHAESGYWRPKLDGTIEVVIAQSTGLVDVQKGTYSTEQKVIQLQSEMVGNASKVERHLARHLEFCNEVVLWDFILCTVVYDYMYRILPATCFNFVPFRGIWRARASCMYFGLWVIYICM
ncbi:UPF0678 fatty acid-binding protein-like protein [Arachis hypogaea]|nr:UPF0678 fatty acid-binding protein-like protein [Arachis hypogaea]